MDQKVPLFPEIIGRTPSGERKVQNVAGYGSRPYRKVQLQYQITLYLVRAGQIKGFRPARPFSGPSGGPGGPPESGQNRRQQCLAIITFLHKIMKNHVFDELL